MSTVNPLRSSEPDDKQQTQRTSRLLQLVSPKSPKKSSADSSSLLTSPFTGTPETTGGSNSKSRTSTLGTPKKKSRSSNSYPGYSRHGYALSKNSKGYSAEDKHKRFRGEDQRWKNRQGSGYSPECYIFSLVILVLLVGLLIFVSIYVGLTQNPKAQVKPQPAGYHFETNRHSMLIMSDNLDCSLYMKKLAMNKMELRTVMLGGLQCFHINEPHSVAPDGSFSLIYYFKHDRDAISTLLDRVHKHHPCTMSKIKECDLNTLRTYYASNVEVNGKSFKEKAFSKQWIMIGDYYQENYQILFRRLARFSDTPNTDYPYPFPEILNEIPRHNEIREPTRIFRVSGLFEKMLKKEKNIIFNPSYAALFNVTNKTKRKDKLIVTEKVARYVSHHYIYPPTKQPELYYPFKLRLRGKPGKSQMIKYVMYPEGATHSVISAFVVKVVYNYYLEYISPRSVSEAELLSWIMKAQKLAYHFFVRSREWWFNPAPSIPSMMSRTGIAVKYMNGSIPDKLYEPRRANVDRSVSIVAWERSDKEELQIIGMSLPSLFGSKLVKSGKPRNFSRFTVNGKKSTKDSQMYSSHASLVIMEELNLDHDTEHIQIVASSSGSVRNAEAVATSVLYQMILNEPPGKATWFGSIYYDIRDGKFYCDYEGVKNDYKRYTDHMKKVYEEAQELAGFKCEPIKPDDFEANDRILMTASRRPPDGKRKRSHVINENPYMTGAIDPRMEEFNYAVGY